MDARCNAACALAEFRSRDILLFVHSKLDAIKVIAAFMATLRPHGNLGEKVLLYRVTLFVLWPMFNADGAASSNLNTGYLSWDERRLDKVIHGNFRRHSAQIGSAFKFRVFLFLFFISKIALNA